MDAAHAAAVAGIARDALADALAAALIKDERDRGVFLAAFDATFPRPADVAERRRRRARAGEPGSAELSAGSGRSGAGGANQTTSSRPVAPPRGPTADRRARAVGAPDAERPAGATASRERPAPQATPGDEPGRARDEAPAARTRTLARLPFRDMSPTEVEELEALARRIAERVKARFRRRLAPRKLGRLDFRRTIRAAVAHGGVPFERRYRGRRPGAPDLVALCDLSASAATATGFFLALLAPSGRYFRRVRLYGFVDRLVEIEFVDGQVRPAAPIDLMARSDFGRVLRDLSALAPTILGGDTVLLILGDARNNRRPPRADLLAAARAAVRRLVWLNPEPDARWNTGDSVIAAYAKHADAVASCGTLADLERTLAEVAKI